MKQPVQQNRTVIGVVSDTHGPLSAAAYRALQGVDWIIHAGDIIDDDVIPRLESIAPVVAVRGNMDGTGGNGTLQRTAYSTIAGLGFYVLHDIYQLDVDPVAAGISVVIHGHTHRADIRWKDGVLYLNPGSAGYPRGARRASVALVTIESQTITPDIVYL